MCGVVCGRGVVAGHGVCVFGVSLVCGVMWIPTRLRVCIQNVFVCTGTMHTSASTCATHENILNANSSDGDLNGSQTDFSREKGVICSVHLFSSLSLLDCLLIS